MPRRPLGTEEERDLLRGDREALLAALRAAVEHPRRWDALSLALAKVEYDEMVVSARSERSDFPHHWELATFLGGYRLERMPA